MAPLSLKFIWNERHWRNCLGLLCKSSTKGNLDQMFWSGVQHPNAAHVTQLVVRFS